MKKWKILNKIEDRPFENLKASKPKIKDQIINILLQNRGIKTKKQKEEFLNPKFENISLKSVGINTQSVRKAIKRIELAIKNRETIVIYGDYDVDGICGTAILWETLFGVYKNVVPYIPHRVDEGYGLSTKGIENLKLKIKNCSLIITVDNGIVASKAVEFAKKQGIDVIITDHHVAQKKLPKAHAIIHTIKLCGTGVAYLLAKEISNFQFPISNKIQDTKYKIQNSHLELVTLATIADLVPLTSANRVFVKFGIEYLRKTKRPGLLALFDEAGIKKEEIGVYEIGHIIAPRLNAAGRISHALDSLRLICTKDKARARDLAKQLGETNTERRILTEELTLHADSVSKQTLSEKFIFVHHETYDQGVIGLIASRLVEKYFRPAIVISEGNKYSKGSARSVAGFNIIEFLREFSHILIDVGGHPMAAGFTIETHKIEEFKASLIKNASKKIIGELLVKTLKIDTEIDFSVISESLYDAIQGLAPFGMANPEPVFMSKNVIVRDVRAVGRDGKHLKIIFEQNGQVMEAIAFDQADKNTKLGDKLEIAYTIDNNYWNGASKLQLKIKDIRRVN